MVPGTNNHPGDGVQRHVYEISTRLARKGFEVVNIRPSVDNSVHIRSIEETYKIVEVPVVLKETKRLNARLNEPFRTMLHYNAYKEAVARFTRSIDSTPIIHTHGFYICSQEPKSGRSKRLATFHGSTPTDMISKGQSTAKATLLNGILKRIYQKYADSWTAISPRVRSLAANLYDIDPREITVTPHGVDSKYFSQRINSEEIENFNKKYNLNKPYKILFLGHLDRNKRPDILLKALSLLKDKKNSIQLVIRSSWGDCYEETLHLIKHYEIQDMVTVIKKPIYGPEFRTLYQSSYAFINTYTNLTGYSTALLEAMACGVPPIISRGSNEDVVDQSTGITLNTLSATNIANSIRSLVEDEKYASMLGQNAMHKMTATFDWDNAVVPTYISAYKKLDEMKK